MSDALLIKATLSTKRVVIMRQFTMKHQRTATEIAGNRAQGNQALLGMVMQEELLKLMLQSIDGQAVSGPKKENLDALVTPHEYRELMKVIESQIGNATTPEIELVTTSGSISPGSVDTPA